MAPREGTAMLAFLDSIYPIRYTAFGLCVIGLAASVASLAAFGPGAFALLALVLFGLLVAVGMYDVGQVRRSVLRNYPIIGHIRYMLEYVRPEIRQYFLESDADAAPFSRVQRSLVYQRAKSTQDKRPFGTQLDVAAAGYEWINHSMAPTTLP